MPAIPGQIAAGFDVNIMSAPASTEAGVYRAGHRYRIGKRDAILVSGPKVTSTCSVTRGLPQRPR
jgi:hypothetical protein